MLLLSQRPLSASDADSELFVDRSHELKRVCRALEHGLSAYVHGPPGIGRTSFLRQVQRRIKTARYARLEGSGSLEARLNEIEGAILGQRTLQRPHSTDLPRLMPRAVETVETIELAANPLEHLRSAADAAQQDGACVVLVDDLSKENRHELFGRLRDDLWELPVQWVVAATTSQLDPPADTFFDVIVELPPLDRDGLHDLLLHRAASGDRAEGTQLLDAAATAMKTIAPCTPRRALTVLRDLYLADDAAEVTNGLSRIEGVRARLKPTANKVLEALLAHGPAHAGDERLLKEAGVTRSRVVQVLAELEAEGLVSAERVGRRKLYAAVAGGDIQEKSGEGSASDRLI